MIKSLLKNLKSLLPKQYLGLFFGILSLKIILMGLFSSEYQKLLFMPFVNIFLDKSANPWQFAYTHALTAELPYHPLMLYILSFFAFFIKILGLTSVFLQNIVFKLPLLLADLTCFFIFLRLFRQKEKEVLLYYFLSPVIIYAAFVHSQLDLIPTVFLFASVFLLKEHKLWLSMLVYGLALALKTNVVLVLPIMLIYILKEYGFTRTLKYAFGAAAIYLAIALPYICSEGYQKLVLFNQKQQLLLDLFVSIGDVKIYLSLFILLIVYLRFYFYKKINHQLLDSFLLITLSLSLLLALPPSPAWYIWMIPFLVLFVLKYSQDNTFVITYILFNGIYLIYFLFFHKGDFGDIIFITTNIDLKIFSPFLKSTVFTMMETLLVAMVYFTCKTGIAANEIYKKEKASVIGIGGDSGSGKSFLMRDIKDLFSDKMLCLEGDGTHKWERNDANWLNYTPLHPKANLLHKEAENLLRLKNMKKICRQDYNHTTGKFDPAKEVCAKQFILLGGLHPFYLPKMRKIIDLKIYMEPQDNLKIFWKTKRDTRERGYSQEQIAASIAARKNDFEKFIAPQKDFADLIISYFTEKNPNDSLKPSDLKLRLTFDSNIPVESIIDFLHAHKVNYRWDYDDDLKHQYIIINEAMTSIKDFESSAKESIDNLEEILAMPTNFQKGLRGFVQLIILRILSEKMKEIYD